MTALTPKNSLDHKSPEGVATLLFSAATPPARPHVQESAFVDQGSRLRRKMNVVLPVLSKHKRGTPHRPRGFKEPALSFSDRKALEVKSWIRRLNIASI